MEKRDTSKVMDVSRVKKMAERVVPSRQLLVEQKVDSDDKPADVPPTEQPVLTDKRKVITPMSTDLPAESTVKPAQVDAEPAVDSQEVATASTPDENATADPSVSPASSTQKALAEAAKANAREQEIEKYIDSRQFYVPVEASARKKSDKFSLLLTVLILLLAAVLIDLMLDSGAILLVQKIPHTHFFTSSSSK